MVDISVCFDPRAGENIDRCATIMCELARCAAAYLANTEVKAVFNGITLIATALSTPREVVKAYHGTILSDVIDS